MSEAMSAVDVAQQREFYDRRWSGHRYAEHLKLWRATVILDGLRTLNLKAPPRILEVGCGTGWLTSILGQFGPATGIDLSPVAIRAARERYPGIEFHALDLATTGFDRRYDVVVSHEVLEHIDDQRAHVAMLARLLAPGGHLILTTPNARYTDRDGGQPIEKPLTARQLRRLLHAHFVIRRQTSIIVPHRYARLRCVRLLERLNFGRHLFVVARRR